MTIIRRLGALLAVLALVGTACGNDDDAGPTTTSPPATDPTTTDPDDTTTTTEPVEARTVSVFFLEGEHLKVGYGREVTGAGVAAAAVEALLEGPNSDDEALGLSSAVPDGTELLGLTIVDNLATVDLSDEFGSGGGTLSMNARIAQVVYTATQFPSVEGVRIMIDGEEDTALGGEGVMLDRTFTRADFEFGGEMEHLKPAILVESPRPGEMVGLTFQVAGRSNTFEAALNFEVVDSSGEVVVPEMYAMATSGTGTPGDFDETIELPDDAPDEVVLIAFERSARDGERVSVSEIPLRVSR